MPTSREQDDLNEAALVAAIEACAPPGESGEFLSTYVVVVQRQLMEPDEHGHTHSTYGILCPDNLPPHTIVGLLRYAEHTVLNRGR